MPSKWEQLIQLRKAAGLSQYELARQLKMTRSALGNYEMGEREPDFETTKKLAAYFGVSVDFLLGRDESTAPSQTEEIPQEWRQVVNLAKTEGYTPDQVLGALRLLESIRRQQEDHDKEEREG